MTYEAPVRQEIILLQQMLGLQTTGTSQKELADPVFICIDCEAFERDQSKVTEVGVAVLDSRDVFGLDPSDREQWFSKMKYAHYRPVEYERLVNYRYVKGCAEGFNFGTTTWVMKTDLPSILKRIFSSPSQLDDAARFASEAEHAYRNIVFVGHGASNDEAYLSQIGFSLRIDADILRTMDTQELAGAKKKRGVALWRLALSLDLKAENLHNAGNDAAYTLQALIAIALKEHAVLNSTLRDLAKYAGKGAKNPKARNRKVAPQAWGGTATAPTAGALVDGKLHAIDRERQVAARDERRKHKQAIRATQAATEAKEP